MDINSSPGQASFVRHSPVKRKLDELEVGSFDLPAVFHSQVRARREDNQEAHPGRRDVDEPCGEDEIRDLTNGAQSIGENIQGERYPEPSRSDGQSGALFVNEEITRTQEKFSYANDPTSDNNTMLDCHDEASPHGFSKKSTFGQDIRDQFEVCTGRRDVDEPCGEDEIRDPNGAQSIGENSQGEKYPEPSRSDGQSGALFADEEITRTEEGFSYANDPTSDNITMLDCHDEASPHGSSKRSTFVQDIRDQFEVCTGSYQSSLQGSPVENEYLVNDSDVHVGPNVPNEKQEGDGYAREVESSGKSTGFQDESSMVTYPNSLHFFVKTYIDGRTVVLHAEGSDTIASIYELIYLRTGLPVTEQHLIFGGRQLQSDQTLAQCNVVKDSTLHLVGRMRSTALPESWRLVNLLVKDILHLCSLSNPSTTMQQVVRDKVHEFLKVATSLVRVHEHMEIFQLSGASAGLVMLLLSSDVTNRVCAQECINLFLSAHEDYLPSHIHIYCVPPLLNFCSLLSKTNPTHSLYAPCRDALARLLETAGATIGSPYLRNAKLENVVRDLSPFVHELSMTLLSRLHRSAKKSLPDFVTSMKDAKDFTAFVIPLCTAMADCKGHHCLGSFDLSYLGCKESVSLHELGEVDACCQTRMTLPQGRPSLGSREWLKLWFDMFLYELDNCLSVVGMIEAASDTKIFSHAPFLVILKGLHSITKIFEDSIMDLLSLLKKHRSTLNYLIQQSCWLDDDYWLLEHKDLLDFESKRCLIMTMLPEPQDDHEGRHDIIVQRGKLLSESLELLAYAEADALQGGISVEFSGEVATGPGVLREWFFLVCREIFNPQNALFLSCPADCRRFFPNPASGINPGHLTYFRFCGRVIALALMHGVQLDILFAVSFFKQLAGVPITWEDAKDVDPCLHESCKEILNMDAELLDSDALSLNFVSEVDMLGCHKTVELCPGGMDTMVNSCNRLDFVNLLVRQRLGRSVTQQVKCFSQGFSDLLVSVSIKQFLQALDPVDLDLMLHGDDRGICVEDWKRHTEYHEYSISDDQVQWFWQVVEGMTLERRRRLLFFGTSVAHLPPQGFQALPSKFHIHRAYTNTSWLPTSHTCFYQLMLPPYSSYEDMHKRLYAITGDHVAEGFGCA